MIVDSVTVGPFEENCYLVIDEIGKAAVLIDPGDDGDRIAAMVSRHGVEPNAVWLTHAHLDHIGAVSAVRRAWPGIPVFLHPFDAPVYALASKAAEAYGVPFEQPEPADRALSDGDALRVGAIEFSVWHVPGHAPGHVAFIADGVAFSGDCVFSGSIGRTDLPMCDPGRFVESLDRLMELGDAVTIHPGHGPRTTMGRERVSNPFLTGDLRVPGSPRGLGAGRLRGE